MSSTQPIFIGLNNNSYTAFLTSLRSAVEPILANNLLTHFTDHSVQHSDRVAELAGKLLDPLRGTDKELSDRELVILYASCYLHDLGMQFECIGNTATFLALNLSQSWNDLQETTRRDILRQHHHEFSAELIRQSVRSGRPPIGIQLNEDHEPAHIANLCAAHAIDAESPRYHELTKEGPRIRMDLLSAFLRLGDILDECRRRAPREKARTLAIGNEAEMHWWRSYYTKDVTFDAPAIKLWFDFPSGREDEYKLIIPRLQLPLIEDELARHQTVFAQNRLNWVIKERYDTSVSLAEEMPERVLARMLKELRARQIADDERQRRVSMTAFKEARPLIQRQLTALKDDKDRLSPRDYLKRIDEIAKWMWDTGSKRRACEVHVFEFGRNATQLDRLDRIEIGIRLLSMLRDVGWIDIGREAAHILQQEADSNEANNTERYRCLALSQANPVWNA